MNEPVSAQESRTSTILVYRADSPFSNFLSKKIKFYTSFPSFYAIEFIGLIYNFQKEGKKFLTSFPLSYILWVVKQKGISMNDIHTTLTHTTNTSGKEGRTMVKFKKNGMPFGKFKVHTLSSGWKLKMTAVALQTAGKFTRFEVEVTQVSARSIESKDRFNVGKCFMDAKIALNKALNMWMEKHEPTPAQEAKKEEKKIAEALQSVQGRINLTEEGITALETLVNNSINKQQLTFALDRLKDSLEYFKNETKEMVKDNQVNCQF